MSEIQELCNDAKVWFDKSECFIKNSDFDSAINCLESSLRYCDQDKPDKNILRNLATCLRMRSSRSQETKVIDLLKGLELSQQALSLDLSDPESYYNLAKANMYLFFATECSDEKLIKTSRSNFEKSISIFNTNPDLSKETNQADLYYNYAYLLVYFQEFDLALEILVKSSRLDPIWDQPCELIETLSNYLRQVDSILSDMGKNCKRYKKRLEKVVGELSSSMASKIALVISMDQNRLNEGSSICEVTLDDLRSESISNLSNSKPVITLLNLKLLNIISYNQAMYLTFIAIDKKHSLIAITIYNLAATHSPSPKDILTIVVPKIETITVKTSHLHDNKTNWKANSNKRNVNDKERELIQFEKISLYKFKDFYINGRRINENQISRPQMLVTMVPDPKA